MMNNNVLVLSSGGIDSTACINYYLNLNYSVSSLFVNYGQASRIKEGMASKKIAAHFKIPYQNLDIEFTNKFSSGYIKGRNALLLSIAFTHFEIQYGIIALGIHAGTNYADCGADFVDHMQTVFDDYSKGNIKIGTPFLKFKKHEIWIYSKINSIPLDLTYSCELGYSQPCGICDSCKDLKKLYEIK
jgi:7-cyano-7-deazaguanine synthase